nr:putative clathrin assembly protein At2g25430 [Ipomoea batatas]
MAPSTIRKAIGTVKDQTSIGIAKVASNMAPELEVAGYVSACVSVVSRRLGKTRDWIVALKCLMLIHRLLNDGDAVFQQEIMYATRRGTRLLNMSDFRDEAHSSSWDHSAFVRTYALYLDQRLEMMCFERKVNGNGGEIERYGSREEQQWRSPPSSNRGNNYDYSEFRDEPVNGMRRSRSSGDVRESTQDKKDVTPVREMKLERIFGKMSHLQRLFDRFLSCRPTGLAKNERMVLVALYPMVRESFKLYADICDVLAVLLDKFFDMEQPDCVKAFDAYASAAKQIDELMGFYNWCKEIGVARSSEYPEVQRITAKLLDTLEEFVRDRAKAVKSPERKVESQPVPEEQPVPDMNEIKALPPPENYAPPPPPEPEPPKPVVQETADLVDLREEGVTADDQGNKFALALFAGPNPAAESGKADWELALVESASHLSHQKATLGGGLDPLLLNGMYDSGIVRQHASTAQLTGGSASSVALPGPGKTTTPVLALPAPDGTVQTVGQDPFAASLNVPPPSYVQMADLEKKQQFLTQEQMVWQQYAQDGMQGQTSLAKISTGGYSAPGQLPYMPYGMPPVNGMGIPPAGYYTTY